MDDLLSLDGRVALISGAGRGVGRQIALHFAAHGAAGIVVNDYFPERADAVGRKSKLPAARPSQCKLTSRTSLRSRR